ncbi:hypothetical protein [Ciceribacter sp. L1K22]|uniref:hypothetical protein n=1 Tax=Ciceribacter sp. L1K22 TaxID=2820275 RepID=UPI001ABEA711|nr:hypothetical protein [Ciceribacter sp. L1K22]MBO3760367.1 hypothetical protein [Ciceribacter sp. L1K22]
MDFNLDLSKRQWTKTRDGITAIGTWLRQGDTIRPCMVLVPAGRELDERLIPCVVTQDRAWIWSEDVGDPAEAARTAFQFAQLLGLSCHEPRTIIRLAMFIHDHLGDLLTIKPFPRDDRAVVAEVVLTNNTTGQVVEQEMTDVRFAG